MTEMQTTQDSGSFSAFYAMMLHIDDDDLDPFEYRLLGHYRKICGLFKSETCTESVETTAKASHMSVAKVRDARKSLEAKGRIKVTGSDGRSLNVTVVNCMAENLKRYSGNPYQKREGYQKRNPYQKREISPTKSDSSDLPNPIADIRIEEKKEEENTNTEAASAAPDEKPSQISGDKNIEPPDTAKPTSETPAPSLKEVPKEPPKSSAKKVPKPEHHAALKVMIHRYGFNDADSRVTWARSDDVAIALLTDDPTVTPEEFQSFVDYWLAQPGKPNFPCGTDSLPTNYAKWKAGRNGASKAGVPTGTPSAQNNGRIAGVLGASEARPSRVPAGALRDIKLKDVS